MNELTKQRVAAVLMRNPETRTNDRMLCVYVWQMELEDMGKNTSSMDIADFFLAYTYTDLPTATDIRKLKRQLLFERPNLRQVCLFNEA